ncbi:MAG: ABC transporter substrate-binding protein [Burkholderiaceae bacterium]
MLLLHQFVRLAEGLPHESRLSIDAVAERLCCTPRNARLLLGRMQAEGWLRWTPGRGRGRLSTLALRGDAGALRETHWRGLIDEGRLEEAFASLPPEGRMRLQAALPVFLGPAPGGGLRIPFYRPLHALDPVHVSRRTEAHLVAQICEGLTTFDRERDAVVPALAHHWERLDEGCRWRLWLRPGLRFHDGRPLGAADAAASLRRLRDAPGPHRALMAHLRETLIEGDRLELVLADPDYLLPHRLAHHSAAVLPMDDWQRPDFATRPIGAGAFRLVRNNDYRATLAAFEGYWRERPLLAEIDLWVVPTGAPMPEVDLRLGQFADEAQAREPDWHRLAQAEQGCDCVLLNPARSQFATTAARLAVGRWLRAQVARRAMGPQWRLARGWLPGFVHLPASRVRDAAAAPRLPAALRIVTYELDQHRQLAQAIADALRSAGCRATIDVLPAPVFARWDWRHDADIAVTGEVLYDDLAFGQFSALAGEAQFHAWLPQGLRRWTAERCKAIAAEACASRRAAMMDEAFERVTSAGAVLPMRHLMQRLDHAPHLGGVSLARCGWMDFRRLWIKSPEREALGPGAAR